MRPLRHDLLTEQTSNNSAANFRGGNMKPRTLASLSALTLFVTLGVTLQTFAHKTEDQIITFDPVGSVATSPQSINPRGEITGFYYDASSIHGFLRSGDGTITTFDAPGAGTGGTYASSINPAGAIAGYYYDTNKVTHGFVRGADGTITTFDAPGAGIAFSSPIPSLSINPAGAITGYYYNSGVIHGFVRAPDNTITTFDPPGAGTGFSQGTLSLSINPAGATTGFYWDASKLYGIHSFVRAADGTITTFDAPSVSTGFETLSISINPAGTITGFYYDTNNGMHGFVRAADGTITTFDVHAPGTGTGRGVGTRPLCINPAGEISGFYWTGYEIAHGFVRTADGTITTFDAPGTTGGTFALSINPRGEITGWYSGANGGRHGFLRKPDHRAKSENELDDEGSEGSESPE
jgi:hypothetical protein